eukprot:5598758-Pyramimonas_sp.AAC.1
MLGRGRPVLPATQHGASCPVDHPCRGPFLYAHYSPDSKSGIVAGDGLREGRGPRGVCGGPVAGQEERHAVRATTTNTSRCKAYSVRADPSAGAGGHRAVQGGGVHERRARGGHGRERHPQAAIYFRTVVGELAAQQLRQQLRAQQDGRVRGDRQKARAPAIRRPRERGPGGAADRHRARRQ